MNIKVDTRAFSRYTEKLKYLHKSALPSAIRNTLNNAAFDVKGKTMPQEAKSAFVQRKPNFFKANSKVEMAKGFNISQMKATVGFVPKDKAVEELEQQERGGTIKNRSHITTPQARSGSSWNKNVKPSFRMSALKSKTYIKAEDSKASSDKQKFVRAAIMAKKLNSSNAFVLGNRSRGKQTLSKINSVKISRKQGTIKISRTPIYTVKAGRAVKIKRTDFMRRASMESGMKMDKMFIANAQKQVEKYLR